MPYDYERSVISRATGLTGVEAEHIAKKLNELNIDPQTIDWMGAMSDARDYGNRYKAVKNYLANYYRINLDAKSPMTFDTEKYESAALLDQASTKQGVKQILKEYYSTTSKQKKAAIKEMLLTEAPLYNVLMTAMYNGTDLPNAKRFLNEAMGKPEEQIVKVELIEPPKPIKTNEKPPLEIKTLPKSKDPEWIIGNPKSPQIPKNRTKKDALSPEQIHFLTQMDLAIREQQPKKLTLPGLVKGGIVKEGQLWKKLLSQNVPKKSTPERLKLEVEKLRIANMPLQLQLERQRLLAQREQLKQLQKLHGQQQRASSVQQALAFFGFYPQQQLQAPLQRPGYYIESRPKLPTGYRWKKAPKGKGKKKQEPVYIY